MYAGERLHMHNAARHIQLPTRHRRKTQQPELISRCPCRASGFKAKPYRAQRENTPGQLIVTRASTPDASPATAQSSAKAVNWALATVVQNRNVSADGSMRTLTLSIEDPAHFIEGRKMPRRQDNTRWIDTYKLPGQMVGIKYCSGKEQQPSKQASRLFAIASSPYESRRESALLDASLIEVLMDRRGGADEAALAEKGPGDVLSVSQVEGRGFSSLFNSYVGLLSAAEESRPLFMLGMGARGMGPLRAALEWTPIQAHATANAVSLFYVTESQQTAAYLADWDSWRQAGATVNPLYIPLREQQASDSTQIQDELEHAIFGGDEGLAGALGGDPRECAVLMSGLPGNVVAAITRRLTLEGVARERILFCDFM